MRCGKWLAVAAALVGLGAAGSPAQAQGRPDIWTGLYVGAHVGGGFGKWEDGVDSISPRGAVGGGHLGYNYQIQNGVIGLEADISASGISKTYTDPLGEIEFANNYLGSVRGRLGYAAGPVLLYGTLGVAFTKVEVTGTAFGLGTDSVSSNETGFVWGGGVEWKFTPNVSIRAEGLQYRFSDIFKDEAGPGLDNRVNVIRGGITYHF
jgi:outer membrane immunogenic protein